MTCKPVLIIGGYLIGVWLTGIYMVLNDIPEQPEGYNRSPEQTMASVFWPAFWFFHSIHLASDLRVSVEATQ